MREETGLRIDVGHVVQVRSGFRLRIEVAFAATLLDGTWELDRREVVSAEFVALDALPADVMPDHRRLILANTAWFQPPQ